ncbi:MAG TPA: acyl-CoA dehydrogenase family protein [Symbiobacteriaceae bacterium]
MDFTIPEELRAIQEGVREFVNRRVEPLAQQIEEEDRIPSTLMEEAARMGLFGLSIPEEYGGLGLGVLGRVLVYEELGKSSNGFTSLIGAHTGIGSTGIVEMGSEDLKRKYLPDMAAGRRLAAFAITEPHAGSDAASIRTAAVKKGDRWILNGQKQFITNGPEADIFTVIAVTDKSKGTRGISAFVVEAGWKGVSKGAPDKKMGLRGSHTCQLFFDDVEVPEENLIGEEGMGYVAAMKILAKGRATLAARAVGTMEKLIRLCTAYAKERVSMGKPLAEHQLIQAYLAEMAVDHALSQTYTYKVAWMADQGMNIAKEAAIAKLFATEAFGRVADKAVQIFGGMGYMREMEVERAYRDARITRIYEGTSEIQKLIIAGRLLQEY